MSAPQVYRQIWKMLSRDCAPQVDESSLHRLALLVLGIIHSKSASPARLAASIHTFGLSEAKTESIERRIRRAENDPEICVEYCFRPMVKRLLEKARLEEIWLILDPTYQDDRLVKATVAVWYRGRALPLVWMIWPANVPLEGDGFWQRMDILLAAAEELLPLNTTVICLADRAFGTPSFIDLVTPRNWHYIVRVQAHTVCQDRLGRQKRVGELVSRPGQRAKLRGKVFKKRGWREASVVVHWGKQQIEEGPLCVASDLSNGWHLLKFYRRRCGIESAFRDEKSYGWHWEQSQVTDLEHMERLLVGMALATWFTLCAGSWVATRLLAAPPTGRRHTLSWVGKRSLFTLGLQRLHQLLHSDGPVELDWHFADWDAPTWQMQIYSHHARAFVFDIHYSD